MFTTRARAARRTMSSAAMLAALGLVAAGCGGDGGGDGNGGNGGAEINVEEARAAFVQKCGSCHTFADAGTAGTFGPPLDDVAPDAETTLRQIEVGGGGMPPNLAEGEEAELIAQYVEQYAGH